MHLPKPSSLAIFFAALLAFFLYVYPDVSAQTMTTTLSVGSLNANPGDTIDLPILISTTTSMRGYQFDVNFDSTRLQVANGSPQSVYDSGWMLSSAGGDTTLFKAPSPKINNLNGAINAAAWALLSGPGLGAQGSGPLTYIRFTIPANAPNGTASVNLDKVFLVDVNGIQIDDIRVVNGWVQIGGGTPQVPEKKNPSLRMDLKQESSIQNIRVVPLDFGKGPKEPNNANLTNGTYPLGFNFKLYYKNQ